MSRIRLVAAALAAAALLGVPAATAAPAAPTATRAAPPALATLAGCVRSEGALAVEFLVDESGSLRTTDPNDDRATAVGAALRNLEALAAVGTRVQVQLAVFSVERRVLVPFGPLDAGSADRFDQAARSLAELDRGPDTDFAAALTGARAALAARREKCRALLLFTDGDYDIQPGPGRAAKPYAPAIRPTDRAAADRLESFGRNLLCRPQGTVDQLRIDGTTTLVVPLTTGISPADQGFLRSIANGRAGGAACGVRGSATTGAYLPAARFGELLGVFDRLTAQLAGGTEVPGGGPLRVCARSACPSGRRTFVIDPGIRRFHVLVDVGSPGLEVVLQPPKAQPVTFRFGPPGRTTRGGIGIAHQWLSPSAGTADVTLPPGGAGVGKWTVTVIDRTGGRAGSLANVQVHVYGDLGARLVSEPRVVIGETTDLRLGLVDRQGTPFTPKNLVRRVQITAQVTDPATGRTTEIGRVEPDGAGVATVRYAVPGDLAAGSVTLTLTTLVTTPSGLVLAPTIRRTPLEVRPPASFPTVAPAEIEVATITGTEPGAATLVVRGGATAAGCVWVEGVTTDALPPEARVLVTTLEPNASSRASCLRVRPNEERTIRLTVAPERAASGPVRAVVKLRLVSDTAPNELIQAIPVRTELLPPVNEPLRLALFVILLVVGLAVPFLFLYVANAVSAKFAGVEFLRSVAIPVRVDRGDLISRLDEPGRLLTVEPGEFKNVPAAESRPTEVTVNGLTFRRVVPRVPVGIPYGVVSAGDRPVTSSGGHRWRRDTCLGRLTLQLAGDWVFVLTRAAEEDALEGELHLFVGDSATGARPDEVVDRAARGIGHIRRLAADAAARAPEPAPPKDGSPTAPGTDPLADMAPPRGGTGSPASDDLPPPPSF